MVTEEQGALIKAAAGRLAWLNVWQYDDDGRATVFVLEVGPGRTVSQWHIEQLVETIENVLGPAQDFRIEGIEDMSPESWSRSTQL
jgi:hypothetical protein